MKCLSFTWLGLGGVAQNITTQKYQDNLLYHGMRHNCQIQLNIMQNETVYI